MHAVKLKMTYNKHSLLSIFLNIFQFKFPQVKHGNAKEMQCLCNLMRTLHNHVSRFSYPMNRYFSFQHLSATNFLTLNI